MEFQELIEKRRSIRKYSTDGKVSRDDILTVIKAAQEAPSWKNSQTGRYYCILSEDMTERFREECLPELNRTKSQNAALIVTTFVRDRAGFQKDGSPDNELGNGWGCYDLGLQNENLILKASELGYSTLIMGIRDADNIRKLLDIPQEEIIVAVIAVGKAAEEPARPKRREIEEIVRFY
ncbi:MAG TPA: nitroreductase family protein [Candidatus Blautia intestinipullorum]|nr:nitroreductase family protein [Candidatus Blautia intestinipullorum]